MPSFSFKKEVKLFLVHDSKKYRIDVNQIEFGQTFQETSYPVKTLHNQSSFEGSVIKIEQIQQSSVLILLCYKKKDIKLYSTDY